MELTEDSVEQAALDWLREVGYTVLCGETIAPLATSRADEGIRSPR